MRAFQLQSHRKGTGKGGRGGLTPAEYSLKGGETPCFFGYLSPTLPITGTRTNHSLEGIWTVVSMEAADNCFKISPSGNSLHEGSAYDGDCPLTAIGRE